MALRRARKLREVRPSRRAIVQFAWDWSKKERLANSAQPNIGALMLVNRIYEHARAAPDKTAVVNSGEEFSYRHLANSIEAVRNHLSRARLPKTGVIANITSNLYHDWVLLLALRSLGHTTISATSWQVLDGLHMRDLTGLVCFSHQADTIETFRQAMPDCPVFELSTRLFANVSGLAVPPALPDAPFGDHITFTSGTTGDYKKVLYSGNELIAGIEHNRLGQFALFPPGGIIHMLNFGPWTAAAYIAILGCWYFGSTVIFDQRSDWPKYFFDYPVTDTFFVPDLLKHLPADLSKRNPDLLVVVSGGFLDAQAARSVSEQLNCRLLFAYGGTEFRIPLEQQFEKDEDVIWLSPSAGSDFEIVDSSDQPVEPGVEGLIRIRCVTFFPREYIDDPETTAKHFRDGWFYPGDLAVQREDGRVRIVGRVDDVLNLAGRKIAIEPFERATSELLNVSSLCVFNQQDGDGNEVLLVVIEGERLPDATRREALAAKVRQFPRIRYVRLDSFPRGTNGMMKVNRRKVLELAKASPAEQSEIVAEIAPVFPVDRSGSERL